jgi:hypothetical protein
MVEKIEKDGIIYAIIINSNFNKDGINFITEEKSILQMGIMSHNSGHKIKPHIHKPFKRKTEGTNEVIYIKKGKVLVEFYNFNQEYFTSYDLNAGDWIILIEGGHGFKIIEDSVMIEVKNGPYAEDQDKVRF